MFEENRKAAIIVYREKEAEYAHLMFQLISAYSDCEVAEWTEKHFINNNPQISSFQKVIFLGDSKESRKRRAGIVWKYEKHGMKYGWLGNQCIVDVDPLRIGRVKAFEEYYKSRIDDFESQAKPYKGNNIVVNLLIRPAPWSAYKLIFGITQLIPYQYELLVREFVLNGGFKEFMEG